MAETALLSVRAAVYQFDQATKGWTPIDGGLSQVSLYQTKSNNSHRIVAIATQKNQPVINSLLHKNLKYSKASEVFGQFQDAKNTYGLNFASKPEAEQFFSMVTSIVADLNNEIAAQEEPEAPPAPQAPVAPQAPTAPPQKASTPGRGPLKTTSSSSSMGSHTANKKAPTSKEEILANFREEVMSEVAKEIANVKEEILAALQERLQ